MGKTDRIIERLVDDGGIDAARLQRGREIAEDAGLPLVRALLHLKLADAGHVARAISKAMNRPIGDLDAVELPGPPVPGFPEAACRGLRVLPLFFEDGEHAPQLVIAMSDPSDHDAGEKVAGLCGKDVRGVLVDDAALTRAIDRVYAEPPDEILLTDAIEPPANEVERTVIMKAIFSEPVSDDDDSDDGSVFAAGERTISTPALKLPPAAVARGGASQGGGDTVVARSPFLDPSRTDVGANAFSKGRVCFVSAYADARSRVVADLSGVVREVVVAKDLAAAIAAADVDAPDDVVVHAPNNDAGTGLLLDRLAKRLGDGVVVVSADAAFAELPCVRKRVPPPDKPAGFAPIILEALFER